MKKFMIEKTRFTDLLKVYKENQQVAHIPLGSQIIPKKHIHSVHMYIFKSYQAF